jgi:hypothetical protein
MAGIEMGRILQDAHGRDDGVDCGPPGSQNPVARAQRLRERRMVGAVRAAGNLPSTAMHRERDGGRTHGRQRCLEESTALNFLG